STPASVRSGSCPRRVYRYTYLEEQKQRISYYCITSILSSLIWCIKKRNIPNYGPFRSIHFEQFPFVSRSSTNGHLIATVYGTVPLKTALSPACQNSLSRTAGDPRPGSERSQREY